MKTLILSLAIAIISITNLNSQDFLFKIEILITDFNGVVANDAVILCYGDWGIITYSEDREETWKQRSNRNQLLS